jgi:predicted Fe-Mo cluster-binding NifX family protein
MSMKVAIAMCKEHVCQRLDYADRMVILNVENGQERSRQAVDLTGWPGHGRALRLARMNVETLVCGAVSRFDEAGFDDSGVGLISGVRGPLDTVVAAVLSGRLTCNQDYWPHSPARE